MNLLEYALYIVSVVVMIATPGPVMILVASAGLQGGYAKALQTIVGTNLASLVLITASILMLKGMLNVNEQLFLAIKVLGCLYIGYLGFGMLKACTTAQSTTVGHGLTSIEGGFQKGFWVGLSNPKDIIFFAAFFPQFIGIFPDIQLSLMVLILTWIVLDFLTLSVVYLAFNQLSKSSYYPKVLVLCGWMLILIAVYGLYVSFDISQWLKS